MGDDELEGKVAKAVKAMTDLASEKGEQKVIKYLSRHTADTAGHEELKKYHGKSVGDETARNIAAKMAEIYHGKAIGPSTQYKGDKEHWLGFARMKLGENYTVFLKHIKDGKITAAASLLEDAIANEDLTIKAHGIAEGVYAMSSEDRLKWGKEMAKKIGPDADAQKLAENPVTAYSTLRGVREATRAANKPKSEPIEYK